MPVFICVLSEFGDCRRVIIAVGRGVSVILRIHAVCRITRLVVYNGYSNANWNCAQNIHRDFIEYTS